MRSPRFWSRRVITFTLLPPTTTTKWLALTVSYSMQALPQLSISFFSSNSFPYHWWIHIFQSCYFQSFVHFSLEWLDLHTHDLASLFATLLRFQYICHAWPGLVSFYRMTMLKIVSLVASGLVWLVLVMVARMGFIYIPRLSWCIYWTSQGGLFFCLCTLEVLFSCLVCYSHFERCFAEWCFYLNVLVILLHVSWSTIYVNIVG